MSSPSRNDAPVPLPPAVWRTLDRHFGQAVDLLRDEQPLDTLDASGWAIFIFVVRAFTTGETRPTQAALAARSGFSVRTVRRSLLTLQRLELLSGNGASLHGIGVGPRLAAILREFTFCRGPLVWRANARRADNATYEPLREPANETYRVATPSPLLLTKKKEDLNSSSSEETARPANETLDAVTLRRLAVGALAALFRRANPGIPLPRGCDVADVRLVEACTADAAGDRSDAQMLAQMHVDAIEGAFTRSTTGDPTPKFIWGQLRHFLTNARIGRTKRLEPAPRPPPPRRVKDEPAAPLEWVALHMSRATAELDGIRDSRPRLPPRFHGEAR